MPKKKKRKKSKKRKDWRKAVQKAMREATEREAITRFETTEPAFNYRWEHVTAVVTLAVRLARLTGADPEVVEAAAWLHDVCKEQKQDHSQAGARFARELLPGTNFPPEKIERVAQAIKDHTGLWRGDPWPKEPLANPESAVLWDADKLAKIGLTAAVHFTGVTLAQNHKTHTTFDLIERGRSNSWQKKTVASMHTEPARRAARARLKAYDKFWNKLEKELKGNDLVGNR